MNLNDHLGFSRLLAQHARRSVMPGLSPATVRGASLLASGMSGKFTAQSPTFNYGRNPSTGDYYLLCDRDPVVDGFVCGP